MVKNLPAMWETWVQSLSQEDPWEGNGIPPQYSCLESFMDSGAWRATVQGVAKSWTSKTFTFVAHLCCCLVAVMSDSFSTLWTVVCQAPLSVAFSSPVYWMGIHSLLQGLSFTQGLNTRLLHRQADPLPRSQGEAPWLTYSVVLVSGTAVIQLHIYLFLVRFFSPPGFNLRILIILWTFILYLLNWDCSVT